MNTNSVSIVDYGIGNLFSVRRALEQCGAVVTMVHSAEDIAASSRLVLPGVGAFSDGMEGLRNRGLIEPLVSYAASGKPLLGICLGMQMLATSSTEFGFHAGLNLIPGQVKTIQSEATDGSRLKSPHIGWAPIHPRKVGCWDGTIFSDTPCGTAVYLVHSFSMHPDNDTDLLAYCYYGGHKIAAAIRHDNIIGCQFHPEKSGPAGLRVLQQFMASQKELNRTLR